MKKKIVILSIIMIILIGIYFMIKLEYYTLSVKTDRTSYDNANGILVKSFWKSAIYLNVNFDNPDNYCSVGIFIRDGLELKLLEARESRQGQDCRAIVTESGYSITNKEFSRIEKSFRNGNIINQMLKNKEQVYLCMSQYDISSMTIDDCYQIKFDES